MDLNKLTKADKVVLGSALLFLIAMFLPWYGIDDNGFRGDSESGWSYFLTGVLPLVLALVMAAQIAITRFSPTTKLPDPPLPWPRVHLIAGVLAAVLVVLRVAIPADIDVPLFGDFELDRQWGLWVALLAAIGLAVGGFLKSTEPETSVAGAPAPNTPF